MNEIQQICDVIREYKTLLTQLADQPLPDAVMSMRRKALPLMAPLGLDRLRSRSLRGIGHPDKDA
jgi:hypothetical protein